MADPEPLIPKHGGYRKLKSFQVAEVVFDLTERFCDKYIASGSRTHDQMVQAARSGSRNITEGSQVSGTSRKMEIKLTNVARSSLEELRRDYASFLRHRRMREWEMNDPRRVDLIARRPATAEDVLQWARDVKSGLCGHGGQKAAAKPSSQSTPSTPSTSSTSSSSSRRRLTYAELGANAALALINVACTLLDRQIAAQAEAFRREGGFTERLYRLRRQNRDQPQD